MVRKMNLYVISGLVLLAAGAGAVSLARTERPVTIAGDTLLVKMSVAELRKASDLAVIGTVAGTNSYKAASTVRPGKEDILTDVAVSVDEFIFNPANVASATIHIRALGGVIGNSSMTIENAPSFQKGEKFFAFLKQVEPGIFEVVGWAQGKYSVDPNGNVGIGDERALARDVFGRDVTIDDLRREVRGLQ